MKELHVTIQNGGPIKLAKCVQCCTKYHCPFCKPEIFKPTVKSKVRKHIKAHEKRAVRFKEYTIFKCGLNCKAVSHFHCPKCNKFVEKKNKFLEHLVKCMGTAADREKLLLLKKEPEQCNMSTKDNEDSSHMSEEQESQPAVLGDELHVTIQNGGPVQLAKCMQCCTKYHCPFCKPEVFKPTVKSKVRKHLRAHEKRAVKFKGYVIFKCGLDCRPISHFHCPKCRKLLEKRNRFMDHLNKCVGKMMGEGGGHHRPVKQEAYHDYLSEEEEDNLFPKAEDQDCLLEIGPSPEPPLHSEVVSFSQPNHKTAFTNLHNSTSSCAFVNPRMNRKQSSQEFAVEESTPTPLSAYSEVEEKSWCEAVRSLQTYQESNIFKSSEVLVNTQCLLELFQFCWLCHKECCITIEGNERLFSVAQDCQSCGYHRDWRSHPPSGEAAETCHSEDEHVLEDEDAEEVVVQIVSSDNECSEQVFIEKDGSYLASASQEVSLEEVKKKRKRKSPSKESSDEWEQCVDEDSDASMDEDLFTALQEDGQGKLVVWCTQCGTEASLSCSVLRHKKVFCCAQCSAGDSFKTSGFEALPVRFDDVAGFQKHAEQKHGSKPCQDCGKFVAANPESRSLKEHKCEHKSKFIICPECGKRLLTEAGLKSHYTQLHSDYDHPCKYCLKVFKTRSAKLKHEQTHPKENQPYICPDCPEKFDNIHKRNNHVISHRGRHKYLCDVCEKGFRDINRLRRHQLVHSGEKPFSCHVCEHSFNQTEDLTSHMCVHTEDKPFMLQPQRQPEEPQATTL